MNSTINSVSRLLKRSLLLCLCLALLAGSALANEVVDISNEGYDCMYYACTLPDGRVIFSGCNGKPGHYMDSKARLLCLNPDTSVSWEYYLPQEGSCRFCSVTPMKDGTLCVYLEDAPYQTPAEEKLMFFTTNGQPTGKEISLELKESSFYTVFAAGLLNQFYSSDESKEYIRMTDWDGNELFRINGPLPVMAGQIIEEEDGLVMFGRESVMGMNAAAKIVKIDFRGNILWENTLPFQMDQNEGAYLDDGIKTSDGCYLARLYERAPNSGSPDSKMKSVDALVKFTSSGRVLWMSQSIDADQGYFYVVLAEHNGKYVMQGEHLNRFASLDYPIRYLWFDSDGKVLGSKDMYIQKEDFPRLKKGKHINVYSSNALFAIGDELWGDYSGENEYATNHEKEMSSVDTVLIKVPEL